MPLISCPACTYSKDTSAEKIPVGKNRITCPQCQHEFIVHFTSTPPAPHNTNTTTKDPRELPFSFTGKAGEYFGIWIVNILLKIITLGFYSPWAKVRKRRYFYSHTSIEGHRFDYLADPMILLRGFVIALVLFISYSFASQFSPLLAGVIGALFFLASPWLIVRSRMFNNRNTSHRNLRFAFKANYSEAYIVFALLPLLTIITFGLAAPYVIFRQKSFLIANNRFGQTPFTFEAKVADYYFIFLRLLATILAIVSVIGGLAYGASHLNIVYYNKEELSAILTILGFGTYLFVMLVSSLYLYVRLSNLNWNCTHIDGNYFHSQLKLVKFFWIILSNIIAISLSSGLLIPWAAIRMTRYRVETLSLITAGSLDHFSAGKQEEISAIGEEIGDIFDIEIGI